MSSDTNCTPGSASRPRNRLYTIYRFTLADNTLVPEDASGTLEVEGRQFKATVVAQEFESR